MMKIVLILCLITISNLAQVTQEWVATYNGPGNFADIASSIAVDGTGNVYVTGYSYGNGTGTDFATIKYNSSGIQQWVQRYNAVLDSADYANSIAIDALGNVYVSGDSEGEGTYWDCTTIKYNALGVQQWIQRYNNGYLDGANSIVIDNSGNVYVTGYSWIGPERDYLTIKYNASGVQQWVQTYNGPGNRLDEANAIVIDNLGNVYVTGISSGNGTSYDFATLKYNSFGVQQWVQRYNGPISTDEANSIAIDNSGNVYVTGRSFGIGTYHDYATIKYNSSGVPLWTQRYNGPGNNDDVPASIKIDSSGNVYVTGGSWGLGTSGDFATIKYNPSGVQQWVHRYNGPFNGSDGPNSMVMDVNGNLYIAGGITGNGNNSNCATIKYNSSGTIQWFATYKGSGNEQDYAYSIAIDSNGYVYITGVGSEINQDYVTIKYSQVIGIHHISSEVPEFFSLSQNYPNPFNPETKIRFNIPKSGFVKMIVYDILGSEIAALVNEELSPGTYEADWDASNYPSGVYYYKLTAGDFIETRKMILIK